MDQQRLGQKDLVPYFASLSKVSEVLGRKRPLSLSMIRRLHAGLGIPAEVLIERATIFLLSLTLITPVPLVEMQERGLFGEVKRNATYLKDYAEELVTSFFGACLAWGQPIMLRATLHQSGARTMDENASWSGKHAFCVKLVVAPQRQIRRVRSHSNGCVISFVCLHSNQVPCLLKSTFLTTALPWCLNGTLTRPILTAQPCWMEKCPLLGSPPP